MLSHPLTAHYLDPDMPRTKQDERNMGRRTREAGRDTGSKAKWLMRRSWRCVPWRVSDNCFSCASPSAGGGDSEVRFWRVSSGAISWLTDANRTAGEAPPAAFFASAVEAEAFWSGSVYITTRQLGVLPSFVVPAGHGGTGLHGEE